MSKTYRRNQSFRAQSDQRDQEDRKWRGRPNTQSKNRYTLNEWTREINAARELQLDLDQQLS